MHSALKGVGQLASWYWGLVLTEITIVSRSPSSHLPPQASPWVEDKTCDCQSENYWGFEVPGL